MYAKSHFRLIPAISWTYPTAVVVGVWATLLTALHLYGGLEWLRLPALPVSVLGTAVSFYLGFKGNAAYERLWEARKIWGGIVNSSRTWGLFATTMVTDRHAQADLETPLADVHRELVYRHLAWLAALRTQLRRLKAWEHDEGWNNRYRDAFGTRDNSDPVLEQRMAPFLAREELAALMSQKNRATQLVRIQGERLRDLLEDGRVEDFRHMQLADLLETFYTLQGQAERIKNFPLPRQYSTANHWFVKIFIGLLPLALIDAFHIDGAPEVFVWLVVPVSTLVGWVFHLWDRVVDYSENPFEGLINDIPMDALSRTIEIDLREMLGETELPPPIQPIDGSILL